MDPMRPTEKEVADARKQANKERARRAEKRRARPKAGPVPGASGIKPAGAVGSPISGSGGAKVRASKSALPQMSRHERIVAVDRSRELRGPLGDPKKKPKKK